MLKGRVPARGRASVGESGGGEMQVQRRGRGVLVAIGGRFIGIRYSGDGALANSTHSLQEHHFSSALRGLVAVGLADVAPRSSTGSALIALARSIGLVALVALVAHRSLVVVLAPPSLASTVSVGVVGELFARFLEAITAVGGGLRAEGRRLGLQGFELMKSLEPFNVLALEVRVVASPGGLGVGEDELPEGSLLLRDRLELGQRVEDRIQRRGVTAPASSQH